MVTHHEVWFDTSPPSVGELLGRLREATGIEVDYSEKEWCISNPYDENDGYFYYYIDKGVSLTVFHEKINYLLGASLAVLESMGGKYGCYIPDWVRQPWEAIKDKADQLPNFDLPKGSQN